LSKEFGVTARLHSGTAVPSGSTICNGSNQKRLSVYHSTSSGELQDLVSDECQATVKAWRDHFLIAFIMKKYTTHRCIWKFADQRDLQTGYERLFAWVKVEQKGGWDEINTALKDRTKDLEKSSKSN
jgi:hypothetical protein